MPSISRSVPVFVSYARADEPSLDLLVSAVAALDDSKVDLRYDLEIALGEDYFERILDDILASPVVVFMVSKAFLASGATRKELAYAQAAQGAGTAAILPVILEDCPWRATALQAFQALPPGSKPVASHDDRQEVWRIVASGIAEAAARFAAPRRNPDLKLFTDTEIVQLLRNVEGALKALIMAAAPYTPAPTHLLIDMQLLEAKRVTYRDELKARIGRV